MADPSPRPRIVICVPVFNEASHIAHNLGKILEAARTESRADWSILVVDDGSTDNTAAEVVALGRSEPAIGILRFTRNFGKEAAILAALEHADGDATILIDSDLQHPPELIPQMFRLWSAGAKVVEAVKTDRSQDNKLGRLLAHLFYLAFDRLVGLDLRGGSDFKLLDRSVCQRYCQLKESGRFFRGLIPWLGFPTARIPFAVGQRSGGESRWGRRKLFRYALQNLTAFSALPLQFVSWFGIASLIVGAIFGITALYQKWQGIAVDGFTTVILLVIFFSGLLMLSLGLIGLYIARIHEEIKARPPYILREQDWDCS